MRNLRYCCVLLLLLVYAALSGQNKGGWIGFSLDNDLFNLAGPTDRYYTSGVHLEVFPSAWGEKAPGFAWCFPTGKLNPLHWQTQYGLRLEQLLYTPKDISRSRLLVADRPFAALLLLGGESQSHSQNRHWVVIQRLRLGTLGPAALGEETQTVIHKLRKTTLPQGWDYQLKQAPVIDVAATIQYTPLPESWLPWSIFGGIQAGNLRGRIHLGTTYRIPIFSTGITNSAFKIEVFASGQMAAVAFDALLGDAAGTHGTSVTLKPWQGQGSTGITVHWQQLEWTFSQVVQSPEFQGSDAHIWGHIAWQIRPLITEKKLKK